MTVFRKERSDFEKLSAGGTLRCLSLEAVSGAISKFCWSSSVSSTNNFLVTRESEQNFLSIFICFILEARHVDRWSVACLDCKRATPPVSVGIRKCNASFEMTFSRSRFRSDFEVLLVKLGELYK